MHRRCNNLTSLASGSGISGRLVRNISLHYQTDLMRPDDIATVLCADDWDTDTQEIGVSARTEADGEGTILLSNYVNPFHAQFVDAMVIGIDVKCRQEAAG